MFWSVNVEKSRHLEQLLDDAPDDNVFRLEKYNWIIA